MSEKCCYPYLNKDHSSCSRNDGWGSGYPDNCDDCGENFCSKHLKEHKKDGTCDKFQNEQQEHELKELEEAKKNLDERIKRLKAKK